MFAIYFWKFWRSSVPSFPVCSVGGLKDFSKVLYARAPLNFVSFEVPSSTEWNYPVIFNPNYFVNISKELTQKINALKMYKNEIKKFPHPRSAKYLKINAEKWGSVSGNEASEAFEIVRKYE